MQSQVGARETKGVATPIYCTSMLLQVATPQVQMVNKHVYRSSSGLHKTCHLTFPCWVGCTRSMLSREAQRILGDIMPVCVSERFGSLLHGWCTFLVMPGCLQPAVPFAATPGTEASSAPPGRAEAAGAACPLRPYPLLAPHLPAQQLPSAASDLQCGQEPMPLPWQHPLNPSLPLLASGSILLVLLLFRASCCCCCTGDDYHDLPSHSRKDMDVPCDCCCMLLLLLLLLLSLLVAGRCR